MKDLEAGRAVERKIENSGKTVEPGTYLRSNYVSNQIFFFLFSIVKEHIVIIIPPRF